MAVHCAACSTTRFEGSRVRSASAPTTIRSTGSTNGAPTCACCVWHRGGVAPGRRAAARPREQGSDHTVARRPGDRAAERAGEAPVAGGPAAVAPRPRAERRPRMTPLTGTNPRAAGLVARKRLEQHGVSTLSDAELLTILAGPNGGRPADLARIDGVTPRGRRHHHGRGRVRPPDPGKPAEWSARASAASGPGRHALQLMPTVARRRPPVPRCSGPAPLTTTPPSRPS